MKENLIFRIKYRSTDSMKGQHNRLIQSSGDSVENMWKSRNIEATPTVALQHEA